MKIVSGTCRCQIFELHRRLSYRMVNARSWFRSLGVTERFPKEGSRS